MNTPWGKSDHIEKVADGVQWVSTPGHGGLMIKEEVALEKLSEAAREVGEWFNGYLCYEEDIAWVVPLWEAQEWWEKSFQYGDKKGRPDLQKEYLRKSIEFWYPAYAIHVDIIDLDNPPEKVYCGGIKGHYCDSGKPVVKTDVQGIHVVCEACGKFIY